MFMCRGKNYNVKEAIRVSVEIVLLFPIKFEAVLCPRFLLYSQVASAECFYPFDNISECKNYLLKKEHKHVI